MQVTVTRWANNTLAGSTTDVVQVPAGATVQEFIVSIRKGDGYTDAAGNWHPLAAVIQIQPS